MQFFEAFKLQKGDTVAITGGGGKTSLMYSLGSEALVSGLRPLLTTTTKILPPTDGGYRLLVEAKPELLANLVREELTLEQKLVVGSGISREGKLVGLEPQVIHLLHKAGANLVIVEADGAAGLSFKAPGPHEPVIPPTTTHSITVVGIDCLGKPLLPQYIHRPEVVESLTGLSLGQPVTPHVVAKVLTHPLGYGRTLPEGCRRSIFLNKVATADDLRLAGDIINYIGAELRNADSPSQPPCTVVVGSAREADPVLQVCTIYPGKGA